MKDKIKTKNISKQPKKSKNDVNKKRPPPNASDGIGLSKQLAQKLQNYRTTTPRRNALSTINKNIHEPRLCGNGKPMPSLAELEQMFEDSDSESETASNTEVSDQTIRTNNNCSTPKGQPVSDDKFTSPNTIKSIAEKMLEYISSLPSDSEIHDDDGLPPPVIPSKKRKKPDVPYIVGCKDRPKVPSKPSVNFCKGDDYGIDVNGVGEDDNDITKPRAKRTKAANISKSIFNAQSDEIAACLSELDSPEKDLNANIQNNFPPNSNTIRSFSPIPSTSRDSDIILKNDHLFNDSLISKEETPINITTEPSETIVIDDTLPTIKTPVNHDGLVIVIDDIGDEPIDVTSLCKEDTEDDNHVEVIASIPTATHSLESPIIVEDYNSIDLNLPTNVDIPEVIDVDEVIAESNAILKKYRSSNNLDTITLVEPNTTSNSIDTEADSSINEINLDTSTNISASNVQVGPIIQLNSAQINTEPTIDVLHESTRNILTNNIPINNMPTENIPMNNMPTDNIPIDNTPTDIIPINNMPTDNIPINNMPTDNIPVDNTPTDIIPINNIPINNMPPNNIPLNNMLTNNITTNNSPPIELDLNEQPINISIEDDFNNITEVRCIQRNRQRPGHNMSLMDLIFPRGSWILRRTGNYIRYEERNPDPNVIFEDANVPLPIQLPVRSPIRRPSRRQPARLPVPVRQPHSAAFSPSTSTDNITVPKSSPSVTSKPIGLDCPICIEDLSKKTIASTICGHVFCMSCIHDVMRMGNKRCPTCRKVLRNKGYHQIFL